MLYRLHAVEFGDHSDQSNQWVFNYYWYVEQAEINTANWNGYAAASFEVTTVFGDPSGPADQWATITGPKITMDGYDYRVTIEVWGSYRWRERHWFSWRWQTWTIYGSGNRLTLQIELNTLLTIEQTDPWTSGKMSQAQPDGTRSAPYIVS